MDETDNLFSEQYYSFSPGGDIQDSMAHPPSLGQLSTLDAIGNGSNPEYSTFDLWAQMRAPSVLSDVSSIAGGGGGGGGGGIPGTTSPLSANSPATSPYLFPQPPQNNNSSNNNIGSASVCSYSSSNQAFLAPLEEFQSVSLGASGYEDDYSNSSSYSMKKDLNEVNLNMAPNLERGDMNNYGEVHALNVNIVDIGAVNEMNSQTRLGHNHDHLQHHHSNMTLDLHYENGGTDTFNGGGIEQHTSISILQPNQKEFSTTHNQQVSNQGFFEDSATPTIVVQQADTKHANPNDPSSQEHSRYTTNFRRPRAHSDSTAYRIRTGEGVVPSPGYHSWNELDLQLDGQQDFLHPYTASSSVNMLSPSLSSSAFVGNIAQGMPILTLSPDMTSSGSYGSPVSSVASPSSSAACSPLLTPLQSSTLSAKAGGMYAHLYRSSSLGGLGRNRASSSPSSNFEGQRNSPSQQNPANFVCLYPECNKRFTRAYNLRSHMRTHTKERPFECSICHQTFVRPHDKKRHEQLHSGVKEYVCRGKLQNGNEWGCGKKFARQDALARHFKSRSGRECIRNIVAEQGGNVDEMDAEGEAAKWESFAARQAMDSKRAVENQQG